jgi:hypothetical protein
VVELMPGDLLLYAPNSLAGWIIAVKTWCRVCHCEVYAGLGESAASRDGVGVGLYPLRTKGLARVLRPNRWFDHEKARWYFDTVRGQKYDWRGLLCFALLAERGTEGKQICSEFARNYLASGGVQCFNPDYASEKVAPATFLTSLALKDVSEAVRLQGGAARKDGAGGHPMSGCGTLLALWLLAMLLLLAVLLTAPLLLTGCAGSAGVSPAATRKAMAPPPLPDGRIASVSKAIAVAGTATPRTVPAACTNCPRCFNKFRDLADPIFVTQWDQLQNGMAYAFQSAPTPRGPWTTQELGAWTSSDPSAYFGLSLPWGPPPLFVRAVEYATAANLTPLPKLKISLRPK